MGKHAGAFKSDKRKKEIMRQKKQDEKRQKRIKKDAGPEHVVEGTDSENPETDLQIPADPQ